MPGMFQVYKGPNSEKKIFFREIIHRKNQTSVGFRTIAVMERGPSLGVTAFTFTDGYH